MGINKDQKFESPLKKGKLLHKHKSFMKYLNVDKKRVPRGSQLRSTCLFRFIVTFNTKPLYEI